MAPTDLPRPTLREVFEGVKHRAVQLSLTLRLWETLYLGRAGEAREVAEGRVATMNNCAPDFFSHVRDIMVDSAFLDVAVLLDKVGYGERESLSIARLIRDMEVGDKETPPASREVMAEVRGEFERVKGEAKSIITHRDRRIGHSDAEVRFNPMAKLDGVTIAEFRGVTEGVFGILNAIQKRLFEGETVYENPIIRGDGESLLAILRRGRRTFEFERYMWQINPGQVDPEELIPRLRRFFQN